MCCTAKRGHSLPSHNFPGHILTPTVTSSSPPYDRICSRFLMIMNCMNRLRIRARHGFLIAWHFQPPGVLHSYLFNCVWNFYSNWCGMCSIWAGRAIYVAVQRKTLSRSNCTSTRYHCKPPWSSSLGQCRKMGLTPMVVGLGLTRRSLCKRCELKCFLKKKGHGLRACRPVKHKLTHRSPFSKYDVGNIVIWDVCLHHSTFRYWAHNTPRIHNDYK